MTPLYLIDASVYIFRAYFAVDPSLVDDRGRPANAIYGYAHFLLDLLDRAQPLHVVAAFDQSLGGCFRHRLYPAYKANRPPAPEELRRQIDVCQALTRGLGVHSLQSERYEADDLIGTVAARFRSHGYAMRFVTTDKDYAQLLEPGDRLLDLGGRRNLDCDGVHRVFGVRADQVPDLLALAGDSVDNIPGVPGIGIKTAAVLLQHLGSVGGIYRRLDAVPALPLRGAARIQRLLAEHRALAELSLRLATIHCDAPVECAAESLPLGEPDPAALAELPLPAGVRRRLATVLAEFH